MGLCGLTTRGTESTDRGADCSRARKGTIRKSKTNRENPRRNQGTSILYSWVESDGIGVSQWEVKSKKRGEGVVVKR